jgi:L-fuconolactonase
MQYERRQFLRYSAAAATAVLSQSHVFCTLRAQDAPPRKELMNTSDRPIIDCHQHLWDLSKLKLPWIKPGTLLGRSFVMSDYREAIAGTGIKNAVYMEVDVEPSQQQAEVDYVTEICQSGSAPTIAAVVSGRPADEGFAAYVERLKPNPFVKGIRQVLHGGSTPAGYCLEERFVEGIRLLGKAGLSFDLCLRPKELADGAKLAEQCPETRFIVDHCGNADPEAFFRPGDPRLAAAKVDHEANQWRRDMEKLAAQRNVICKISGIVARVPKEWSAEDLAPIVNHCLDTFGPQRVVFGSDWPVCLNGAPLPDWVAALKQIIGNRPAAEQTQLLHDNAVQFYGLKQAA